MKRSMKRVRATQAWMVSGMGLGPHDPKVTLLQLTQEGPTMAILKIPTVDSRRFPLGTLVHLDVSAAKEQSLPLLDDEFLTTGM